MAKAEVNVVIADLPRVQQLVRALAALLKALAKCDGLPEPVVTAADQVRLAVAALGGKDVGPPPSDEERIREAMAEAQDYPGRIITR